MKGRKIVVKEDFDAERDKFGRIVKGSDGGGGGGGRGDSSRRSVGPMGGNMGGGGGGGLGNTFGLSPQFLDSLGINCPLNTKVFVANLAYNVDEKKMREVFRLAGRVVTVELSRDKEGKSRGFGVVTFDHPVEAVQAISMLNNQNLCDRRISVRIDKLPDEPEPRTANGLPDGLSGVGMGLGSGGQPLTDVAKNLPSPEEMGNMGMGSGNMGSGGDMGSNAAIQTALASIATILGGGSGGAPAIWEEGTWGVVVIWEAMQRFRQPWRLLL